MRRAYYSDKITDFVAKDEDAVLGALVDQYPFDITPLQRNAWVAEIQIMQKTLKPYREGKIYFEYEIPRLGGRIDVLAVIDKVIFVIEFKVGATTFASSDLDQVCDYALDLKNFHETSHAAVIAPILVATDAAKIKPPPRNYLQQDALLPPIMASADTLGDAIHATLANAEGPPVIADSWERGRYSPTPTIIEAATALYGGHSVAEISRSDAGATNLRDTSAAISEVIKFAKQKSRKAICFVTGVPGAGKTLVGLDIATKHMDADDELYSVFLSGNGPLVNILREALARDKVRREREHKKSKLKIGAARSEVKAFIQNVHNFRDDCIRDEKAPIEHVALFDEAQRAWDQQHTANFMRRKKGIDYFDKSEPEFLIECMDRHADWATIVCLVGGGQEIDVGEVGIGEWVKAVTKKFPHWHIYISSRLTDSEYRMESVEKNLENANCTTEKKLHLSVSMRSFRTEKVALLVKQMLDLEAEHARQTLRNIGEQYSIVLTRDLRRAKKWLRDHARGSERYGMVMSSEAMRLKPLAIDAKLRPNPIHWFLNGKDDVRSSFYLEDAATEFEIQGLEIDWACLIWDADFRYASCDRDWQYRRFRGSRWNHIRHPAHQTYLKNVYRVLLTRARQGMVIVVPNGDASDPTRKKRYYDPTFAYLHGIGFKVI